MATITEDYVSFETAKLLKEKGFDEKLDKKYFGDDCSGPSYIRERWEDGGYICPMSNSDLDDGSKYADISAPTLQMAMKWLRKVHHIAIVIAPSMFWGKYNVSIYKKGNDYPFGFDGDNLISSYEEACDTAIKYCLENLI